MKSHPKSNCNSCKKTSHTTPALVVGKNTARVDLGLFVYGGLNKKSVCGAGTFPADMKGLFSFIKALKIMAIAPGKLGISESLAIDPKSYGKLKASVAGNSIEDLKKSAQAFESLFLDMLLKNMRQSIPQNEENPLESDETKTFTSMLDQQWSSRVAKHGGIGLADAMVRQLQNSGLYSAESKK